MAFVSGNHTRTDGTRSGDDVWAQNKTAGVKITTAQHDLHDQDISDSLDLCVLKDGTQTITADMPWNAKKLTGLGDATAHTDACNAGQVQDGTFVWGGTSGGSGNAQTLSMTPAVTAYATGQGFVFDAGFTNTGAMTINVDSVGAKSVKINNGSDPAAGDVTAGETYKIVYDGTNFVLINPKVSILTSDTEYTAQWLTLTNMDYICLCVHGHSNTAITTGTLDVFDSDSFTGETYSTLATNNITFPDSTNGRIVFTNAGTYKYRLQTSVEAVDTTAGGIDVIVQYIGATVAVQRFQYDNTQVDSPVLVVEGLIDIAASQYMNFLVQAEVTSDYVLGGTSTVLIHRLFGT